MAIMVGTGRAALAGILIKNAEALETLEKVDTIVVDKTGTLTEGRPQVVAIIAAPGWDEANVLRIAATLERASEHPLAAAILARAKDRGIALGDSSDFQSRTGKGVIARMRFENCCARKSRTLRGIENSPGRARGKSAATGSQRPDGRVRRGGRASGRIDFRSRSDQIKHGRSYRTAASGRNSRL